MDPLTIAMLVGGGSNFLSSFFGGRSQEKLTKDQLALQRQIAEMEDRRARDLATQGVAADEAASDPWAQAMAQMGHVSALDALERATYSRPTVSGGHPAYAWAKPTVSGGFDYTKSPELVAMAAAAKRAIASGQGRTPTMTTPANYGKTGGLDLTAIGSGARLPTVPSANLDPAAGTGWEHSAIAQYTNLAQPRRRRKSLVEELDRG